MAERIDIHLEEGSPSTIHQLIRVISESRRIKLVPSPDSGSAIPSSGILQQLQAISTVLSSTGHSREAEALQDVYTISHTPTDFAGLGLSSDKPLSAKEESEVLFLASAYLESLNSTERAKKCVEPLKSRPVGRRGMTLSEKIFAAHDIEQRGEVKPGDVVRVDVDWILASELSWGGMERIYDQLGKPGIFRNDRFWLAGDHVVDPRIMDHPKIKPLVEASERAKRGFKMTENQGMNYTIMHTEFCRQRAQPGMLVIGSDSHTCSAGSVSSLAIGLGVADVTMPLITGETWFRIPESVNIRFINKPKPGIGGKDVILYILKELKRNTVASDRVVEYTGPGLKYLSCDARFAIANMTTEFGGVTGIFAPDEVTYDFINRRKNPKYKKNAVYFRPDDDAEYAVTHTIDLAEVELFVARYPCPDDVVPVTEMKGIKLDGCFIGACTTTEEDLVLAALVLEEGLKRGLKPAKEGKRKVVPGSRPILNKLRTSGLADVYERAGFEVGIPGCSYCVGMSADKAEDGETWLTSQNRNFENRMGPGAFGNLASAVTVAASSFKMEITSPQSLLDAVDIDRLHEFLGHKDQEIELPPPIYVEPGQQVDDQQGPLPAINETTNNLIKQQDPSTGDLAHNAPAKAPNDLFFSQTDPLAEPSRFPDSQSTSISSAAVRTGKIALLGDFIDTDALAPAEALVKRNITPTELGEYCLCHTHPDFRSRVRELGHNIVVAGRAFGCGSSRENAVTALQGAGVQCVIAQSFAFIYGRNQPNLGLLGFVVREPRFWEVVREGAGIRVDLDCCVVQVQLEDGRWEGFGFQLSRMERMLNECGGVAEAFGKWGKGLWQALCGDGDRGRAKKSRKAPPSLAQRGNAELQW